MPGQNDVNFDAVYQSNSFGPFKFLEVFTVGTTSKAIIQFIETGTVLEVYLSHAFNGLVKDPFRPNVYGVGYLGNANNYTTREYSIWHGMMARCYNTNHIAYPYYGAKGVTVCNRWHCFGNFIEDLPHIQGYDLWVQYPGKYELDKDTLQINLPEYLKVYSPETCCFIDKSTNSRYAAKYQNQFDGRRISKYTGVTKDKGKPSFRANIVVNGHKINLGNYASEAAAANMYNYASEIYRPNGDLSLLNDVQKMTFDEILAYRRGGKNMCEIIHK